MARIPTPHEFVWIEAPHGYLAGSFHAAAPGRIAPAVLMCHGFTGHRIEAHMLFVQAARAFAASGISALRFDFSGSGESAGAFADMTVETEIRDAAAALDYLARRPDVDGSRLAVLGLSLGGAVGACLAGRDSRVGALVLWSAVADLAAVGRRFTEESPPPRLPDGTYDIGGLAVGRGFVESLQTVRPLEEVVRYSRRALVVHGSADYVVPLSHAQAYADALGERARLHIVRDADHTFASVPWQIEAIEVTLQFLQQSL